jgi:hypothetical protein
VAQTLTRPVPVPGRTRDAHYLWSTLAIAATVYLGFWFTYFGPQLSGTYPAAPLATHVHGWSFFLWYALLPLQAALVRARRVSLHRTLGALSIGLAVLMVATGLLVVGVRMAEVERLGRSSFWSQFGPAIFVTLVLFTGFYVAALVLRRRPAAHKRLMIVASVAGMGAAAFRILVAIAGPVGWAAPVGVLATNLFIVWEMLCDRWRDGRVHPVYRIGFLTCVVAEAGTMLATPTAAGQFLARALAWVGRTLAFLY